MEGMNLKSYELLSGRFGSLTEIQKLAMPGAASGSNLLIFSPTGSGKTEAALLPLLERIGDGLRSGKIKGGFNVLWITPLKSLNRDMLRRFEGWCAEFGATLGVRHGDTSEKERAGQRETPPNVLIMTPEALQGLLVGRVVRGHLGNVCAVVVDELHDLLDNKRGAQLSLALERLEAVAPGFQRIGLSATIGNKKEAGMLFFGEREYRAVESSCIREYYVSVVHEESMGRRVDRVAELIEAHRKVLVFTNTRSMAEELGAYLKERIAECEVHHGSLDKKIRIENEERFKAGGLRALVCTSSLELGIDIGDVDLVVQYGSPKQVFRFVQRVGRSGHSVGKIPKGVIIATDLDEYLEAEVVASLAKSGWLEDKRCEKGALDVVAHQCVGYCLDNRGATVAELLERFGKSGVFGIGEEKLVKTLMQLVGEGVLKYEMDERAVGNGGLDDGAVGRMRVWLGRRGREYYYQNVSTIPKDRRFLVREAATNRIIANLDEEFVAGLENGACFLAKGQPWKIIEIEPDEVVVEQAGPDEVIVPSWTGEDIPVDFEVAQRAGRLRRGVNVPEGEAVPDDRTVVLEGDGQVAVLNMCFGTKVNGGIARVLAKRLGKRLKEEVVAGADQYRVLIRLPYEMDSAIVLDELKRMDGTSDELEGALQDSPLLKLGFTHVGQRIGLLSEGAQATNQLIRMLRNSVVYEEAVREVFARHFDTARTAEALDWIKSGRIAVRRNAKVGRFGALGLDRLRSRFGGAFETKDRVIAAFKERMLDRVSRLRCANCEAERFVHIAGLRDDEKIPCPRCGKASLAPKDTSKEDIESAAGLIRNYGKRALIALETYGVGARSAGRVLRKLHKDENQFYLDLLEEQKKFIKNRKYWSGKH